MASTRQQWCLQLDDDDEDCGCGLCLPLVDYEVAAKEASKAWGECRAAEQRYKCAARDLDLDRHLRRAVWAATEALALHLQRVSDSYNAKAVTHPAHAAAPTPPIPAAAGDVRPQRAAAVVAEVLIAAAAVAHSTIPRDGAGPSVAVPAPASALAPRDLYAGRSAFDAVFGDSTDDDEELEEDAVRAAQAHGGPLACGYESPEYHSAGPRTPSFSPEYHATSPFYSPGAVLPLSCSPSSSGSTPSPTWSPASSPSPTLSTTPAPATQRAPSSKRARAASAPLTYSKRRSLAPPTPSPARFP